jgi:hypothetical protein
MKYLITESKLEKVIFRYLDNQDFIQIESGETIYFANSKDDEKAQIRYDEGDGYCEINNGLINEISSFFSLNERDSIDKICSWIESTTGMDIGNFHAMSGINIYI